MAQEVERVEVSGKITAPAGEDVEEISVYNISSEKGTVTNEKGVFKLKVAENDHIQITALQFQSFRVIINANDMISRKLMIYLNPNVNQLEEVTVRSTDLLGIAELDVKNIKTSVFIPDWDLSYTALEYGYNFHRDGQMEVDGNAAEKAMGHNNIPMARVDIMELVELFFPKKNRSKREIVDAKLVSFKVLVERYDHDYLSSTFGIPAEKVNDFIYFAEENGLTPYLLKPENEIELLEYLLKQSENYKEQFATKD
jgi:hypothetical protein